MRLKNKTNKLKKSLYKEFTKNEIKLIKKLNSPSKIQDYLNSLEMNFDYEEDTCRSPMMTLREKKAHCIEGAILAAAILYYHGGSPLILDLESTKGDYDHVITVFKKGKYFGAISKTNHAVLRYREPVYLNIRELVMSYFNEYFLTKNGNKTLRRYSQAVDLSKFNKKNWICTNEEVWFIADYLTEVMHFNILNKSQISSLRKADDIEMRAGKIYEYPDPAGEKFDNY